MSIVIVYHPFRESKIVHSVAVISNLQLLHFEQHLGRHVHAGFGRGGHLVQNFGTVQDFFIILIFFAELDHGSEALGADVLEVAKHVGEGIVAPLVLVLEVGAPVVLGLPGGAGGEPRVELRDVGVVVEVDLGNVRGNVCPGLDQVPVYAVEKVMSLDLVSSVGS